MELFRIGFLPVTLSDMIDIAIVSFLFFRLLEFIKGSISAKLIGFIISAFVLWKVVEVFNFIVLKSILTQFWNLGALAFFVLFTPEIRRILTHFADRFNIQRVLQPIQSTPPSQPEKYAKALCKAFEALQKEGNGALVVLCGNDRLTEIEQEGVPIHADISALLIISIFQKESPLHDGAMIIRNGKIIAVHCILPISDTKLPEEVGTRHRAAVGLAELTDAFVIILSEEKNTFSMANQGQLYLNVELEIVEKAISEYIAGNRIS